MASLQAPGARLLWVSPRLFLVTQAMASLQAPGARCPLWVGLRLFLVIQAMASLQAPGARLLWVSPRLFLVIQAMASLRAPGARCPLWVGLRLFLVIQARGESPDLYCPFQRPFRDVDEHKPPPVCNLVSFPSLFMIFSFIREDLNTHPSLTNAVRVSFPSTEIGMSEVHTCVTGTSPPLPPLTMKGFLSYTCTVFCLKLRLSISNLFLAVLVRGYTRHSPRISGPQVSFPSRSLFPLLGRSLECPISNCHWQAGVAEVKKKRKEKKRLNCHLGEFTTSSRSLYNDKMKRQNGVSVKRQKRKP